MEAELADGRILEFPDGTDPSVIQATVKKMLAGTPPAPAPGGGGGGVGVAGIPGTVRPPEVTPEPSFIDKYVRAPIETAASVATGIPAALTGQVSGIVSNIFGGKYGTQAGIQQADKTAGRVADYFTYHPRGEAGQDLTKKVGDLSQNLVAVPIPTLGDLGHAAVPVVRAARDTVVAANPASDIGTVLASQRASKQIEAYRDTAQRAQAAKDATDLGIKINPAESNPTLKTKAVSTLAGGKPSVDAATAAQNIAVDVPKIARQELGIAPEQVIDRDAFKQVYEEGAKPAQEIRKIPLLEDTDGSVTAQIEALRPGKVLGKSSQTGAVNAVIDDAVAGLEGGLSGDEVINSIQQNRKDARTILNSKETGVIDKAKARASLGIANSLETLIDNHLTATGDTKLLNAYKEGRALQAKAHVWEDAWDANTGKFDPQVIAEKTAGDNAITGNTLKVGQIAGNFPGSMSAPSASALRQFTDLAKTHLTRTGPLGVTGAALGTIIPGVGTAVGGLLGMAAGEIAAPLMRRGLMGGGKGIGQPNALPPVTSLYSPYKTSPIDPNVLMPGEGGFTPYPTPMTGTSLSPRPGAPMTPEQMKAIMYQQGLLTGK